MRGQEKAAVQMRTSRFSCAPINRREETIMKAIILKPGRHGEVTDLDLSYNNLRSLVGGNIEMTYPFEDEYLAVISNEEAKLLDLPPNRAARRADGTVADIYCGTMVVVALATEGEYRDLTNKEAKMVLQMWGPPEDKDSWGGAKPNMAIRVHGLIFSGVIRI
jgi:hypothetical protein